MLNILIYYNLLLLHQVDLESFGPIFITRHAKGHRVSVANLDFTPDDLNHYFLSVADKLVSSLLRTSVSPLSFCSVASSTFHLSGVSESDVISIINGLESKKTSGVDGILVRFI